MKYLLKVLLLAEWKKKIFSAQKMQIILWKLRVYEKMKGKIRL